MPVTIKSAREIELMAEAGRILEIVHNELRDALHVGMSTLDIDRLGAVSYTHLAVVKPGRVMFEISGVAEEVAKEALRLATHKLPCKCKVVSRADLEGGDNSEN